VLDVVGGRSLKAGGNSKIEWRKEGISWAGGREAVKKKGGEILF